MAKASGIGARLYVQGRDISGDTASFSAHSTIAPLDVTSIMDTAMVRIPGLRDAELSVQVFFNNADDETHDYLSTMPSTDILATVVTGVTAGAPTFSIVAKQGNFDADRGTDGSMSFDFANMSTEGIPLEAGRLLVAKTTHASADDETGIDHGAQTTSGAVGILHHFSAASGTVEYDIEDSSDSTDGIDGSWANLLAFSDVATPYAPIAQRVAVAGTVERWVRASTNGTFTDAVFSMSLRRRGAGDFDAA